MQACKVADLSLGPTRSFYRRKVNELCTCCRNCRRFCKREVSMENEDHMELYVNNSRRVFTHLVRIISLVGQWKTQGQVCTIQVLLRDSTFLYSFTQCIFGQALSLPSKFQQASRRAAKGGMRYHSRTTTREWPKRKRSFGLFQAL